MQVTIKQLIKELGELCDKHASIESFHYGDTLKLMKSGAINYATVLMNISQSPMGRDITNFNIELLVLDRVITGDNECQLDVENNTNKIVRDLVSVMSYSTRWRLFSDMLAQNPVQKYYDHLPDAVTGWGVTISLQTYNDNGICDLPIFDYDYNQPISDADCDVLAIVKNTSGDFLVTKIVSDLDNVMTVPDITVTDSDGNQYQKASGVDVVCTPGGGVANVTNSNGTFNDTVNAGDTLVLADINNVQSDGSIVPTPAQTPFVCDNTITASLPFVGTDTDCKTIFEASGVTTFTTAVNSSNVGSISYSTDGVTFVAFSLPFTPVAGAVYYFKRTTALINGNYSISD